MIRRVPTLVFALLLLAPLAAQGGQLGTVPGVARQDPLDARWLPWLGCWALEGDAVDYRQVGDVVDRTVCVTARPDARGVNITTYVDGAVALEETLLADGERRPLTRNGCEGWQEASWSRDGHRLLTRAELDCDERPDRGFSGLGMLVAGGTWVDIESVGMDEHRELLVRRYRRTGAEVAGELGIAPPAPERALAAAEARVRAAGPLDVDDVIEASGELPPEVVEAAILESDSRFAIDSQTLLRLAEAGLSDQVVDLMVAVSFPEHFVVDRGGDVDEGRADYPPRRRAGYVGYGYPPYGLYGPHAAYWLYDPFFAPFHFGSFGYFPRRRTIRVRPAVPDTGSLFGGKVIQGRGYARVRARSPESNGGFFGRLVNGAIGAGGSGSSASGTSATGSSGSGAKATPKGFTKGSSGGRKAVRRGGGGDRGGGGGGDKGGEAGGPDGH